MNRDPEIQVQIPTVEQPQTFDWDIEYSSEALCQTLRATGNSVRYVAACLLSGLVTTDLISSNELYSNGGKIFAGTIAVGAAYKAGEWARRAKNQFETAELIKNVWGIKPSWGKTSEPLEEYILHLEK